MEMPDVQGLVDQAQAAVDDLKQQAEDAIRRGLQALVNLGQAAQDKLDELDAE